LCQNFHTLTENQFRIILKRITLDYYQLNDLSEKEMKEYQKILDFLTSFLCDFDFILPKGKLNFEENKMIEKKQYYLVPLLFPYKKPKDISLSNGKLFEFKRDHEWIIQVFIF
jgi:hypothetical protein